VPKTTICEKTLSEEDVSDFSFAITRQYWFELFMDDLPMWGYVGEARRPQRKPKAKAAAVKGGDDEKEGEKEDGDEKGGDEKEGEEKGGKEEEKEEEDEEGQGAAGETQLLVYPHWQLDISYNGDQARRGGRAGGPGGGGRKRVVEQGAWQQAAGRGRRRVAGGWRAGGGRMASGWRADGERVAGGRQQRQAAAGSAARAPRPALTQALPHPPPPPQIIHVNLTQHDNKTQPVRLEPGTKVAFTYAVTWTPTTMEFDRRFEKYLDYSFFEHKARPGGGVLLGGREGGA
jgi:hypothetical protein